MHLKRFVSHCTQMFYSKTVFHDVETRSLPIPSAMATFCGLSLSLFCQRPLHECFCVYEKFQCTKGIYSLQSLPADTYDCLRAFSGCGSELVLYTVKPVVLGSQCTQEQPWQIEVARPMPQFLLPSDLTTIRHVSRVSQGSPEGPGFSCPQWLPGLASFSSLPHFFTLFWFFPESFLK